MASFILWYLTISLIGLLAFPLAYRLFPALPDRGYAFSRALGVLLWGYVFWLLGSLGALRNDLGGMAFALGLLAVLSGWLLYQDKARDIRDWFQRSRKLVIGIELLFLLAFAAMTFIRMANPDITNTEKPMELAFINAIIRSPTLPPHDPWLAGYAISYYYFGYVLVSMLAVLTSVPVGEAFNLALALTFALGALGAYGIVYNLLAKKYVDEGGDASPAPGAIFAAYLAPVFVLIVSNVEGFLEFLHARGLFWTQVGAETWETRFWKWLDIKDLSNPPGPTPGAPNRFLWWWRASRVVKDYDLAGNPREIIDEFPFFSYLLGDLHPHVLAIPFVFLLIALALNLYFGGGRGHFNWLGINLRVSLRRVGQAALGALVVGFVLLIWGRFSGLTLEFIGFGVFAVGIWLMLRLTAPLSQYGARLFSEDGLGEMSFQMPLHLSPLTFAMAVIVLGGLAFLNTWDFPINVVLFVGAYVLLRVREQGWAWARLGDFLGLAFALVVSGVLIYLPFYIGFNSQAGGILPNLINPTRGAHLWVMFGTLLVPLLAFMLYLWLAQGGGKQIWLGVRLALALTVSLWLFAMLFGWLITFIPVAGDLFLGSQGLPGLQAKELLQHAISLRFSAPWGWVTLTLVVGLALGLLLRQIAARKDAEDTLPQPPPSHTFALLLILTAALLVLAPEFIYLRDQFGTRMNTIFKFYYQAWLLWGVAAAYGSAVLLRELRGRLVGAFGIVLVGTVFVGLAYPILSLQTKTNNFAPRAGYQLDGITSHGAYLSADDFAAAEWLSAAPLGTMVEAVGGSYTAHARMSAHTGMPILLGWPGHESQWRGGAAEQGSRQADIEKLYASTSWDETQALIDAYDIKYIYVGNLERSAYRVNESKFHQFLEPVFEQGQVVIFGVP